VKILAMVAFHGSILSTILARELIHLTLLRQRDLFRFFSLITSLHANYNFCVCFNQVKIEL